jgi:hypothetical protein
LIGGIYVEAEDEEFNLLHDVLPLEGACFSGAVRARSYLCAVLQA